MKKSFYGLCAMAIFALAMTSNSFDNSAFTADTIAAVVTPTVDGDMSFDGRNSATISVNGTSSSISGSGSISVTSEGGTGSASITSSSSSGGTSTTINPTISSSSSISSTSTSTSSSSSTSSGTTTGGPTVTIDICSRVQGAFLRALFGCDD